MRISDKQIEDLRVLLHKSTGIEYSSEELQAAGLSIMRFVYAKELRKHYLNNNPANGLKD